MDSLHYFCQGESHKADDKVCQDFAYSSSEKGVSIAVVCDGHGGNRYFRSDVGARYAAEITVEAIREFIKNSEKSLFRDKPFTAVGPVAVREDDYKETEEDSAFRQLFAYIIAKWNSCILEHAANNGISEWESEHVEQKYLDDFNAQSSLEKIYGCTLMAFVSTRRFWFAFHLGDGKCIAFQPGTVWCEPIPWDDRCFLNKTTSICDSDALNEFRYCYQGDGHFPVAVFLGSDGIDDSFGETENMVNFYIQLAKEIAESESQARSSLEHTLPELSRIGSRDDMSVACVYDRASLKQFIPVLLDWQIEQVQKSIEEADTRISSLAKKSEQYVDQEISDTKSMIESRYVQSDLSRARSQKEALIRKINKLLLEKEGEAFIPYTEVDSDHFSEENIVNNSVEIASPVNNAVIEED